MIDKARIAHPDVEFIYTEPLGVHEYLAQIVLCRLREAAFATPEDIEKRSFEIIGDEEDLSGITPEQASVVKRVIHATADFEFRKTLVFHPEAIKNGVAAIRAGKDILTDVEMVKTGINKRLLEQWGGKVICKIQNSKFKIQNSKNKTKAEMGIESALKENNNIGIIAIGNAPTALLKIIDLLNNPHYASRITHHGPLVVGVPVGFVKALESKALLSTQRFPFITNLSRKGGSPVAAAIVNALLKMAEKK
ncbi:MAG: precorrin-8X methylmutase [Nitrospira bacterium HGW-Nitrospira-1]|nr:MAG: precorrin-8X methylmutase [Nitrospira bacterium HGW-Nitrospira-1]